MYLNDMYSNSIYYSFCSYTFNNIQENAILLWKFHRLDVIKEFWDRPWLPSPFIIVEDIARIIQWFTNRKHLRNQAFSKFQDLFTLNEAHLL